MPPESTPEPSPVSPDEMSDSAEIILAKAKLKEAEAALATARTPFVEKLILRGVLPIALAIVGPWAALTFSEQGRDLTTLSKLVEQEKKDAEERKQRSVEWRERMSRLEEEKAAELTALSNMVTRLDSTLKTALIQMAVTQLLSKDERLSRDEVGRDVAAQVALPGLDEMEVQRIAEQQYDRVMQAKGR